MEVPLHLLTLICILVFVIAVVVRFVKTAMMPVHLRWEIYPVAHDKEADHGGSYFEYTDWRQRSREHSLSNKLKEFLTEFLFLKALFHHKRSLWFSSFPFHFGLYLLAGFAGLLVLSAVLSISGHEPGSLAAGLIKFFGLCGAALCLFGSFTLFLRRILDPDLRKYSPLSAYFNLLLFVAVSSLVLLVGTREHGFAPIAEYARSFFTWNQAPRMCVASKALVVLSMFVLAYIPLTHMSHFFMKWFTWDKIRWDDEPNLPGSKLEKRIEKALSYPVSWSAPHIKGDGKKNWVDVATEEVER